MTGFTFVYGKKDIFVETAYKRKTEKLAKLILHKLNLPDNPGTVKNLLYYLQKAECEIHTLNNGRQYYEIHGEGFGGKGSFVDDGMTEIIKI